MKSRRSCASCGSRGSSRHHALSAPSLRRGFLLGAADGPPPPPPADAGGEWRAAAEAVRRDGSAAVLHEAAEGGALLRGGGVGAAAAGAPPSGAAAADGAKRPKKRVRKATGGAAAARKGTVELELGAGVPSVGYATRDIEGLPPPRWGTLPASVRTHDVSSGEASRFVCHLTPFTCALYGRGYDAVGDTQPGPGGNRGNSRWHSLANGMSTSSAWLDSLYNQTRH